MNYLQLMQKGLKLVVKEALKYVSENGLAGESYFYITFKTNYTGVLIPGYLLSKYPEKMTIVLHHEFWDLEVFENYFSVSLIFNNVLENLRIPFSAIYRFEDPNEPIALDFLVEDAEYVIEGQETNSNDASENDNIISLDKFRKTDKDKLS